MHSIKFQDTTYSLKYEGYDFTVILSEGGLPFFQHEELLSQFGLSFLQAVDLIVRHDPDYLLFEDPSTASPENFCIEHDGFYFFTTLQFEQIMAEMTKDSSLETPELLRFQDAWYQARPERCREDR